MAEFKEVMRQYNYMCNKMVSCDECPLYAKDLLVPSCQYFTSNYSDEAETIITKWYAEHKPCTNGEMLKRIFGAEIPFNPLGCVGIYPTDCDIKECNSCQYNNFWEQEYKENR